MLIARSRYQGVWNIIRFNWPLFLVALLTIVTSLICAAFVPHPWNVLFRAGGLLAFGSVILSLVTSWMIYDRSSLYDLTWLRHFSLNQESCIVNLSAGFDETSEILKIRVPAEVIAMDFYDPVLHSEPSIRRARGVYSPSPELLKVTTSSFPQPDESVDLICMILSAHEVRKSDERTLFFSEARRILKPSGRIVVIEHLRDWANFFVYNIGFFHFHSHRSWLNTFSSAGLNIVSEDKHTPFLSRFTLQK